MIAFLSLKSFRDRKFVSFLCVLSISLSLSLFFIVEKLRIGIEESFTNSISNADLIVGARSGPLQLLLYSIFHKGSPTNNITFDTYQKIRTLPSVSWTIPLSLGDSYRGHRVVATDQNFFQHYQFQGDKNLSLEGGKWMEGIFDVVLGSRVAGQLNHKLGDSIIISHGISEQALLKHEKTPFQVVGILKSTGTPVDKSVYITLYGMEAIHKGWEGGVPYFGDIASSEFTKEKLQSDQITSFILRTKNRIALLGLQRYLSTFEEEALSAVIPAMALGELWEILDQLERVFFGIGLFVIVIGFFTILIALFLSLEQRQKEMFILRSLGVSATRITFLLLAEAALLSAIGVLTAFFLQYAILFALNPVMEEWYSLSLHLAAPTLWDLAVMIIFVLLGPLFGIIPAIRAWRLAP